MPQKTPPNPPEWTRSKMLSTAAGLFIVLGIVLAVMMLLLSTSIRERKVEQKLERAVRDLSQAKAAISAYHRMHGKYPSSTEENTLPEDFATFFADQKGGQPFYQEQGRFARLDIFSSNKPYGEALVYYSDDNEWVLVSRGPDMDVDLNSLDFSVEELGVFLENSSYDPTNGAESGGDIWVGSDSVFAVE